jgi:catechol 2,3-dioxygenase-like lactoylglutathione lyase family enzyme
MKRLHVHVAVEDLAKSIGFYSTLFGAEPVVLKDDYAKWMLDNPRVNFAISDRVAVAGVDHLGIQVESSEELEDLAGRLKVAGEVTRDQEATTCCYAQSDKAWVNDPSGLRWETFFTFGETVTYGEDEPGAAPLKASAAACCAPAAKAETASAKSACC